MGRKRPHSDDIGDLQRAAERIEQQPAANPAPLRFGVDSEPRQDQQWNWMAPHSLCDTLGRVRVMHLAREDRIEADDFAAS